jgi:hypothetical protein
MRAPSGESCAMVLRSPSLQDGCRDSWRNADVPPMSLAVYFATSERGTPDALEVDPPDVLHGSAVRCVDISVAVAHVGARDAPRLEIGGRRLR